MTLPEVERYLLDEYGKQVAAPKFEAWIKSLIAGPIAGQRLAISIALETAEQLVDKARYIEIFNAMDYSDSPTRSFSLAILNERDRLYFTSQPGNNEQEETRHFGRVMPVDSFFKYYGNWDEEQFVVLSPDDLDTGTAAGEDWRAGKRDLAIREIPNTKPQYLVVEWVFLLEHWHAVCPSRQHYYTDSAPVLADYLGLTARYDNRELACLIYPDDFDEPTYQPCAVNQYSWDAEHLYMAYRNRDNFGRTRSRSGDVESKRLKEQVHFVSPDLKYKYKALYLGRSNSEPIILGNIIQECLNRFDA